MTEYEKDLANYKGITAAIVRADKQTPEADKAALLTHLVFEYALSEYRQMTEAEKEELPTTILSPDGDYDKRKHVIFTVLEWDAELRDTIGGPCCLIVPEETLPEVYNIGTAAPFVINGEKRCFQILDVERYAPLA